MIAAAPRRRDFQWWLALAAGPAFWAGLCIFQPPNLQLDWPWLQPWLFVKLALLLPLLEEYVFRGGLQPWLAQRLPQRWAVFTLANGLTTVLFASLHLLTHPPLWALAVVLPSLLFGYFRERHASVVSPMLLHAWYNAGYFWLFHP